MLKWNTIILIMNNKEEIVLGYLEPIKNVLDTDDDFPSYVNGLPVF